MNQHLSEEQIARWLVEGPAREDAAHARDCEACRSRLAEARFPLSNFREAWIGWSEAQDSRQPETLTLDPARRRPVSLAWAAGLALAAFLAAVFFTARPLFEHHAQEQTAVAHTPDAPVSDAVLMQQVDEEVSEAVPDALAPLTDLVSWQSAGAVAQGTSSSTPQTSTTQKRKKDTKENE